MSMIEGRGMQSVVEENRDFLSRSVSRRGIVKAAVGLAFGGELVVPRGVIASADRLSGSGWPDLVPPEEGPFFEQDLTAIRERASARIQAYKHKISAGRISKFGESRRGLYTLYSDRPRVKGPSFNPKYIEGATLDNGWDMFLGKNDNPETPYPNLTIADKLNAAVQPDGSMGYGWIGNVHLLDVVSFDIDDLNLAKGEVARADFGVFGWYVKDDSLERKFEMGAFCANMGNRFYRNGIFVPESSIYNFTTYELPGNTSVNVPVDGSTYQDAEERYRDTRRYSAGAPVAIAQFSISEVKQLADGLAIRPTPEQLKTFDYLSSTSQAGFELHNALLQRAFVGARNSGYVAYYETRDGFDPVGLENFIQSDPPKIPDASSMIDISVEKDSKSILNNPTNTITVAELAGFPIVSIQAICPNEEPLSDKAPFFDF